MRLIYFLSLLLLLLTGCNERPEKPDVASPKAEAPEERIDTLGQIVMRTRRQNKLYTAECRVHKVVLYTDNSKIGGRLLDIEKIGYRKAAVPIDVTLKGSIDFSRFAAGDVARTDSLIILTLPDPQITLTAARIDHKAARQYVSSLRSNFTDEELTRLARQGVDTIMLHLSQYGLAEASREAAGKVLVPMLRRLGFADHNIVIRFRKDYGDADLKRLVRRINSTPQ